MAAMPTRRPVNDPGPATTAKASTSVEAPAVRARARSSSSPGSRSPCVRARRRRARGTTPSSQSATLPARVAVSSARTTIVRNVILRLVRSRAAASCRSPP